ncbi:type II toxin-antitoxin system mRNA interferase toxin, RelE/StbE family [Lactovum odontotermitis]
MDNLAALFGLTIEQATEVRDTIIDAIEFLALGEKLPEYFLDHVLQREPWSGYHEFHVLDDLLVVYYKVDSKRRVRMVTITSHQELSTGKLQN